MVKNQSRSNKKKIFQALAQEKKMNETGMGMSMSMSMIGIMVSVLVWSIH